MDFIKKASKIFANDKKSLKEVVKKEHWLKPFLTIIGVSFLVTLLDMGILEALILVIATILLAFISAGLLHFFLKYFGGVANFKQTLTINFNIQLLPSIIFGGLAFLSYFLTLSIPTLGKIISSITILLVFLYIPWFIIIMTQSLSQIHKVSLGKSYLSQIISLLITAILGFIFLLIFIYIFLLPDPILQQILLEKGFLF